MVGYTYFSVVRKCISNLCPARFLLQGHGKCEGTTYHSCFRVRPWLIFLLFVTKCGCSRMSALGGVHMKTTRLLDILRSHLLQPKFSCGCWQSAKPNAASCASFTWPSALKHARRPRRQEKREAVAGRVGLGGRREKNQISSIFRQLHFMSTGRARVSSPSTP